MDSTAGRSRSRAFGAGLVLSCGLALAATFLALDRLMPLELPIIGPKWEYFDNRRDDYTFVAVGTSYTYRHFVPHVFDRVLREAGIESQSFNFGVSRMALAEAYLVVDELVRRRPPRLKWLAIDLSLFPDAGDGNRLSTRDIWWHTPTETSVLVQRTFTSNQPLAKKLATLRQSWEPLLRNMTTAGRGARPFRAYWDRELEVDEELDLVVKWHGYESLEALLHVPSVQRRFQSFQGERDKFATAIKRRRAADRPRGFSRYQLTMLKRIATRASEAGFVPIFFEPPAFERPYRSRALKDLGPVFSYNDPKRYPELYKVDRRFDRGHLKQAGAEQLSELFAQDVARYIGGARASR